MRPAFKVLYALVGAAALFCAQFAHGLSPLHAPQQLHHTRWTAESGAPPDERALAQTPDGFLWIGTQGGLYRFDGVRFEKFQPRGALMPSVAISALLATPSGDLWIGYQHGSVARLHDGVLQNMSEGSSIRGWIGLARDPRGSIYMYGNGGEHAGLARFVAGRWQVMGRSWGLPSGDIPALLPARNGVLWVEAQDKLFFLRPGARRFETTGQSINGSSLTEGADGRIWSTVRWSATAVGWNIPVPEFATRISSRPIAGLYSPESGSRSVRSIADRLGNIWTTTPHGVVRVEADASNWPRLRWNAISAEDGLAPNPAGPLLEDSEGDIWIGTNSGLDRLRPVDPGVPAGVPLNSPLGFWASADNSGGVYIATGDKLYRAYADRPAETITTRRHRTAFLYTDRRGDLWVGGEDRLQKLDKHGLKQIVLPSAAVGDPVYITQDSTGAMLISVWNNGVFRQSGGRWTRVDIAHDPRQPAPDQIIGDRSGRVWLNFNGSLSLLEDGRSRRLSGRDGLNIGRVQHVAVGSTETIAAGDFGLARFDGQRFHTLSAEGYPDLSGSSGVVQTSRGETWINAINGVVLTRTKDLDWAFSHPGASLPHRVFGLADGLPGVAQEDNDTPSAVEATDGRVWFLTSHGVAWIDSRRLIHNPLSPPVAVRSVTTGQRVYAVRPNLQLPPGSKDVQIDYTALSLVAPERVHFRYRLDGVDRDWIDPGGRRQAFYNNLPAGNYRFHVKAANNDGVWNNDGAVFGFAIEPTFFQSYWFYVLCAVSGATLLSSAYLIRTRQLTSRMQARMEVRLSERERIARELHDTLLQGFQGLVLRFQAAAETIPRSTSARRLLDDALDRADRVLVEGRDRIIDLRSATREASLAETIAELVEGLTFTPGAQVRVIDQGDARSITATAFSEIRDIAEEALFNAYRHAKARSVEVGLTYSAHELRLSVRDDGIGISPEVITSGGRSGHYGLTGMRERAESIQSRLLIMTRQGGGTEIELIVPGRIAYPDYVGGRWRFARGRTIAQET